MRVAFCIFKYFPYGGIQRDLMKMARECLQRGHEVRIYAIHWRAPDVAGPGVELCLAPVRALTNHRLYQRFAAWVRADVQRRPVDLLVGMNKMPGLDVYFAGELCYSDKAARQGGFWRCLSPRGRVLLKAERAVFDPAVTTEILTLCEAQAPIFRRCYGTPAERFHPLPPGIERDRAAPDNKEATRQRVRRRLGLEEADHLLLFVGSGFITKGLDRLLRGLRALPSSIRGSAWLYVLGADNHRPFRRLAAKLGVAEHVRFMGGRADVPDFLMAADAFVLPAYHETAGMAILEAMIAGVPVLVTEVCGYAPYVRRMEAGLVAGEPFTQQKFNALLAELLTSERREQWAANGAALARDETIHQLAGTAVDLLGRFAAKRLASTAKPAGGLTETYLGPDLARQFTAQELFAWAQTVEGRIYRQVKGRSTLRVTLNGQAYFLKRHQGVGWKEIVKNWLVAKRPVLGAENEWRACLRLAAYGIAAPKVAAFARQGGSPARRNSFVLCEELAGFVSLEAVAEEWAAKPPSAAGRRRLVQAVAELVRGLHAAGVAHRDLYICHLLLHRRNWAQGVPQLAVLDLHRARLHKPIPAFWRKRDLAALLFSTLTLDVPRFSRLRFLRAYAGRPLREELKVRHRFWRAVVRRAASLHHRAQRRQASLAAGASIPQPPAAAARSTDMDRG